MTMKRPTGVSSSPVKMLRLSVPLTKGPDGRWKPLLNFLQAVAKEEGFYVRGSRPQRNNNPGDVEWGRFALAHGAIHSEQPLGRFAVFSTSEAGFAAMKALFEAPVYSALTVEQALNKWAPPVENETNLYIKNVCSWVGCQPTDKVADLLTQT